jgi:putative addiction module component (TIGR02574 family)
VIPTLESLGIDRLSINEKLELIARIWESLPPDAVPEMPAECLADLQRRLARPAEINEVLDRNWTVACAINEEARRIPQSSYFDKYVGIANGQVVVVTDDRDELETRLMQVAINPWFKFSFRAGLDSTPAERV